MVIIPGELGNHTSLILSSGASAGACIAAVCKGVLTAAATKLAPRPVIGFLGVSRNLLTFGVGSPRLAADGAPLTEL